MSLKAFHVLFIVAAVSLTAGFGAWSLRAGESWWGIAAFVLAAGLTLYLARFIRRTRQLPFVCAVCLGNPASPLTQSANLGVLLLLVVVLAVLGAFAGMFLFWVRSASKRGELQLEQRAGALSLDGRR